MKKHLKTHKLGHKLWFIKIQSYWNHIFGPGTWIAKQDDGNWFKSLLNPQFVLIKHIKNIIKPLNLDYKLGFIDILSYRNPVWGTDMWIGMQDDSNWGKSLPDTQFACINPMKTNFKTNRNRPKKFRPMHMDQDDSYWALKSWT